MISKSKFWPLGMFRRVLLLSSEEEIYGWCSSVPRLARRREYLKVNEGSGDTREFWGLRNETHCAKANPGDPQFLMTGFPRWLGSQTWIICFATWTCSERRRLRGGFCANGFRTRFRLLASWRRFIRALLWQRWSSQSCAQITKNRPPH